MSAATYAAPAAVASATAGRAARRARVGAKVGSPRRRSGTFSHGCFLISGAAHFGGPTDPWRRAGAPRAACASASRAPARGFARLTFTRANARRPNAFRARLPRARVVPRGRRLDDAAHDEPTNQRSPKPLPPRPSSQASRATRKSVTTAALSEPPFQAMVRPDPHPHPSPAPRRVPPPAAPSVP